MFAAIWDTIKVNWDLLWWKWNQAMQNHAKNGEKNVYAIELLLYVLYAYIACGAIIIIGCILVWLGYLKLPERKLLRKDSYIFLGASFV